jgi:hypothetical protein
MRYNNLISLNILFILSIYSSKLSAQIKHYPEITMSVGIVYSSQVMHFSGAKYNNCFVVRSILPNSKAAIKEGDCVFSVDGKGFDSREEMLNYGSEKMDNPFVKLGFLSREKNGDYREYSQDIIRSYRFIFFLQPLSRDKIYCLNLSVAKSMRIEMENREKKVISDPTLMRMSGEKAEKYMSIPKQVANLFVEIAKKECRV